MRVPDDVAKDIEQKAIELLDAAHAAWFASDCTSKAAKDILAKATEVMNQMHKLDKE